MDVEGGNHDIPETSCWNIFGLSGKIMLCMFLPKIIYYVIVIFLIGKLNAFTSYLGCVSFLLFNLTITWGLISLPSCNKTKNDDTSNHRTYQLKIVTRMFAFSGVLLFISLIVFSLSAYKVFPNEYMIWIMCDMFYQLLCGLALITYSTLLKTREAASQRPANDSALV